MNISHLPLAMRDFLTISLPMSFPYPRTNPKVNPTAVLPVNGIPKSEIVRFVVWPLTLLSPGIYFVAFSIVNATLCETSCSLCQSMLTIC